VYLIRYHRGIGNTNALPVSQQRGYSFVTHHFPKAARLRHGGRLNFVYCNGHAELLKVEQLLLDYSDRALLR